MPMSVFDVLVLALYCACGMSLGRYLALQMGPIYGVAGFALGILSAMLLRRLIGRLVGGAKQD